MIIENRIIPHNISRFCVTYKGSGDAEMPEESGASHILEHLICNRMWEARKKWLKYGVEFNACTSDDNISFYMQGMDRYVKNFKNELLTLLKTHYTWTKEEIENEKKIIENEREGTMASVTFMVEDYIIRNDYGYRPSYGTAESIQRYTPEILQNFYDRQFKEPYKITHIGPTPCGKMPALSDVSLTEHYALPMVQEARPLTDEEITYPYGQPCTYTDRDMLIVHNVEPVPNDEFEYLYFWVNYMTNSLVSPLYVELRDKRQMLYSINTRLTPFCDKWIAFIEIFVNSGELWKANDIIKRILCHPITYFSRARFNRVMTECLCKRPMERINDQYRIDEIEGRSLYLEQRLENITYEGFLDFHKRYFETKDQTKIRVSYAHSNTNYDYVRLTSILAKHYNEHTSEGVIAIGEKQIYNKPIFTIDDFSEEQIEKIGRKETITDSLKDVGSTLGMGFNYFKAFEEVQRKKNKDFSVGFKWMHNPQAEKYNYAKIDVNYEIDNTIYFVQPLFLELYYSYPKSNNACYFNPSLYSNEAFGKEWAKLALKISNMLTDKDSKIKVNAAQIVEQLAAIYNHYQDNPETYKGKSIVLRYLIWTAPADWYWDGKKWREMVGFPQEQRFNDDIARLLPIFKKSIKKVGLPCELQIDYIKNHTDEIKESSKYKAIAKQYWLEN